MKKYKVLMVSSDYLPNIGGIAAHVHNLSLFLSKNVEINVVFAYNSTKEIVNKEFAGTYIAKTTGKFKGIKYALKFISCLFGYDLKRYDIVHCHNFMVEGLVFAMLRKLGIINKLIFTNHSSQFLEAFYGKKRMLRIYRIILNAADKIICPSEELAETSIKVIGSASKVKYIYNGVDLGMFKFENQIDDVIPTLLLTRRHERKNGVIDLLEAVAILASKNISEFRLLLIGQGSQTNKLKAFTIEKGLKNVEFLNNKTQTELVEYYQKSAASCLPSHLEAVSISGLESLACGTPILGSNVGGIPELIDDGITGYMHKPNDPEDIAQSILKLLDIFNNSTQYSKMRKASREKVEKKFSWDTVCQYTLKVYEEI